ncbi:MAG: hypothetical protein ABSH56_34170 [Bryobacteraceae bacterium]|jgi:hypothetical protein
MVVRIRFGKGVKVSRKRRKNQRVALAVAALLTPAAFLAFVLGLWQIAADLSFASNFAISSGVFSHWHIWLGSAALLQFCAYRLNRYGKSGDTAAS